MGALSGRRILITGISRGVGFETARLFLSEGAEVMGSARDPERLEAARARLADAAADANAIGRLTTIAGDVRSPELPARLAAAVEARWGALDILLNNAGIQIDGHARGLTDAAEAEAMLAQSMDVNLMAPYRLARALLPLLRRGREPRIMNVTSGAGTLEDMRLAGIASYRLSKWALNGLTLLLATELAGAVAVNAFDPGWVKTDLGGPNAPGHPVESARAALHLATLPFSETGKLWKNGDAIAF
jgi:NAD(P)-dependent dehydrogenase (short-subunit alcohol dehydrogenase family)